MEANTKIFTGNSRDDVDAQLRTWLERICGTVSILGMETTSPDNESGYWRLVVTHHIVHVDDPCTTAVRQ